MASKSDSRISIVGLLIVLLGILMLVAFFVLTRRESEPDKVSQRTSTPIVLTDSDTPTRPPAVETPTVIFFVYDASIGQQAPIAGAVTSFCDRPTEQDGRTACPWLLDGKPWNWQGAKQNPSRQVTFTVEASDFYPTTVITHANVTQAVHFAIGLQPRETVRILIEPAGDDLVANGDFVGLEGWEIQQGQKCTHCWMREQSGDANYPHYLAWERTRSGADGAAIWAKQTLNYDVRQCQGLTLSFDVRVDHHSLSNSGWLSDAHGGSGEYPVKVRLLFTDAQGRRFEWSHGFLSRHDGSTNLVNYSLVPQDEWRTYKADLLPSDRWVDELGEPLPSPATLTDILVGGNGWDFAGAAANLRLSGCYGTISQHVPPTPTSSPIPSSTPLATTQGTADDIVTQRTRIDARQSWQTVLPSVKQGDLIKIEYIGGTWAVWGGPGGVRHRADGTGYADERPTGDPLSSAPAGALIGRISNGEPFYVGNEKEFRAPQSGALALQINDVMCNDNTGGLWVQFSVTPSSAQNPMQSVEPTSPSSIGSGLTPPDLVEPTTLVRLPYPVNQVAFSPDGKTLAVASSPDIHLYDVGTLAELRVIDTETAMISVAFSPDGQILASGSHPDGAVQLWQVSTGALLRTLEGHLHGVWSVAYSSDGQTLASGSLDHTVRLWQVGGCTDQSPACGTLLHTLSEHPNAVTSVAFAPDGQTLAVGVWDHSKVWLWRVGEGELLNTLRGDTNRVTRLAFAPDQHILVSGSQEGKVLLWRSDDGSLLHTLEGHEDVVYSVTFAPDGQTIASGSLDNTVRLWRVSGGALLYTLDSGTALVTSVAFAPDGQTLASGSHDGTVQLWDLATMETSH